MRTPYHAATLALATGALALGTALCTPSAERDSAGGATTAKTARVAAEKDASARGHRAPGNEPPAQEAAERTPPPDEAPECAPETQEAVTGVEIPGSVPEKTAAAVKKLRAGLVEARREHCGKISAGAFASLAYTAEVAARITGGYGPQSEMWLGRARELLRRLRESKADPYPLEGGRISLRGYRSPVSEHRQGYAVYIPPDYDPKRSYPLMVVLHGGTANGNLFLGVVLGNNMSWKKYREHLWDAFEPRWKPDWIVMAPDGFGHVMWRWMGERDVLDAVEDVKRNYNVDPDRVVLGGLSNGGVGAYSIGLRHAWQFSAVMAMAGAPSWLQYAGGRMSEQETSCVRPYSGLHLAENAFNTDFRYYHGRADTGPMKPRFVDQFTASIRRLRVPFKKVWYQLGHDILYAVHKHGRIYEKLAGVKRNPRPREVRLVTGDYRASRQHWVTVTRIARYPELGRVRARVEGRDLIVDTSNIRAFSLDMRDAPLEHDGKESAPAEVSIRIDGSVVYRGPPEKLGDTGHFIRESRKWKVGAPGPKAGQLEKKPGLSGPLTDAYFDATVHVYGTGDPGQTERLKRAAEKGSKGWPLWLWRVSHPVLADTEVTPDVMLDNHLVLYGTPGANRILEQIKGQLPIKLEADAIVLGEQRFSGQGLGTRFIYPNPLSPRRYVIVQWGLTVGAVAAGHNLPDFLPDYVVYDERSTRTRERLAFKKSSRPLALGFFDGSWQLPEPPAEETAVKKDAGVNAAAGGSLDAVKPGDERPPGVTAAGIKGLKGARFSLLPVPKAPATPRVPRSFNAPPDDPAGVAAREIARRVAGFPSFRALSAGANWRVDARATWSIRPQQQCLDDLKSAGIGATLWIELLPTPVPTPVQLQGPVDGVWFRSVHEDRPFIISCELATRLPALVAILKRHGVTAVEVMSDYRPEPRTSFHTMGLALDMYRFQTRGGFLDVTRHFEVTPEFRTCEAPPPDDPRGRKLLQIVCALGRSKKFSSVITPNYNVGHRDHIHIDARPDDPRFFLR